MVVRVLTVLVVALALAPAASARGLSRPESSLLVQMNSVRRTHALPPLRFDARLERAARWHSRDMIANGYFGHGAFGTRMLQFDVGGSLAGENLAWGQGFRGTPRGIVAAWLASPDHRANLLKPSFRRVGVGALVGPFAGFSGATVVTADFAG